MAAMYFNSVRYVLRLVKFLDVHTRRLHILIENWYLDPRPRPDGVLWRVRDSDKLVVEVSRTVSVQVLPCSP